MVFFVLIDIYLVALVDHRPAKFHQKELEMANLAILVGLHLLYFQYNIQTVLYLQELNE